MLSEVIKKLESNPDVQASVKALIEDIVFEFATAGNDPDRLAMVQADIGKNLERLVKAALATPLAEGPKPTDMALPAKISNDIGKLVAVKPDKE